MKDNNGTPEGRSVARLYTTYVQLVNDPEYQRLAMARRMLWLFTRGGPPGAAWRSYADKMQEMEGEICENNP